MAGEGGVENLAHRPRTRDGHGRRRLACTREVFEGQDLSDTLNWLESVISNIQLRLDD